MSIRYKFIIFFMIFSLAPLLAVTIVGQREIVRMGDAIAGLAKKNRTEIVSRELQQTAEDYAKILAPYRDHPFLDQGLGLGHVEGIVDFKAPRIEADRDVIGQKVPFVLQHQPVVQRQVAVDAR